MKRSLGKLALSLFLLICLVEAKADAGRIEEWTTEFKCGDKKFSVRSECRASKKELSLNTCSQNQQLVSERKIVRLPTKVPGSGKAWLYAIQWRCIPFENKKYLEILYSTGEGQREDDEGSEVFDSDLTRIEDKKMLIKIYRNEEQGDFGYIRSIMPE